MLSRRKHTCNEINGLGKKRDTQVETTFFRALLATKSEKKTEILAPEPDLKSLNSEPNSRFSTPQITQKTSSDRNSEKPNKTRDK